MTDRVKGLIVTLEHDMREDDVLSLMQAISHFRKVAGVSKAVVNVDDHINREQVRIEFKERVWNVLSNA